jgi:thiol:disulfide interchange protein DsbD
MKATVLIVGVMTVYCVVMSASAVAQKGDQHVKWDFATVRLNDEEVRLIFTANLDAGWYIYSQFVEKGCAMPTTFLFIPDKTYSLNGKVREESTPVKGCNNFFGIDLARYMNSAVFTQDISLVTLNTTVRGKIAFMGCSDNRCLLPDEIEFALEVKAN